MPVAKGADAIKPRFAQKLWGAGWDAANRKDQGPCRPGMRAGPAQSTEVTHQLRHRIIGCTPALLAAGGTFTGKRGRLGQLAGTGPGDQKITDIVIVLILRPGWLRGAKEAAQKMGAKRGRGRSQHPALTRGPDDLIRLVKHQRVAGALGSDRRAGKGKGRARIACQSRMGDQRRGGHACAQTRRKGQARFRAPPHWQMKTAMQGNKTARRQRPMAHSMADQRACRAMACRDAKIIRHQGNQGKRPCAPPAALQPFAKVTSNRQRGTMTEMPGFRQHLAPSRHDRSGLAATDVQPSLSPEVLGWNTTHRHGQGRDKPRARRDRASSKSGTDLFDERC